MSNSKPVAGRTRVNVERFMCELGDFGRRFEGRGCSQRPAATGSAGSHHTRAASANPSSTTMRLQRKASKKSLNFREVCNSCPLPGRSLQVAQIQLKLAHNVGAHERVRPQLVHFDFQAEEVRECRVPTRIGGLRGHTPNLLIDAGQLALCSCDSLLGDGTSPLKTMLHDASTSHVPACAGRTQQLLTDIFDVSFTFRNDRLQLISMLLQGGFAELAQCSRILLIECSCIVREPLRKSDIARCRCSGKNLSATSLCRRRSRHASNATSARPSDLFSAHLNVAA